MRLINTKTLQIEEFTDRKIPRYAILSHTWGNEELTFQDWLYVQNQCPPRWGWSQIPQEIQRLKSKEGYDKVVKACEHARQHNPACQWLWADTVCIDKISSAELSEAINSMFEWYRRAEICYAFLADVPPMGDEELRKCSQRSSPFRQSRWFRRGWTLQELIAPWSVVFLSKNWTVLGTKSTLAKHIATITSIPENCLSGSWSRIREQTSIAQKMSWAAWRQTTRIEDRAYCLMGLFEINMPLLYGEGEKAFIRLQEQIIQQTEDLSFLAWKSDHCQTFARDHFIHWKLPPLADSPSQFFSARNVILKKSGELLASKRVFTANTGTFIHRPLLGTLSRRFVFAPLNSEALTVSRRTSESVWMPLSRDRSSQGFSRSSFPTSTIFTALDPSRCRLYTGSPSETSLRRLYEPFPERHYFRKSHPVSDTANTRRQVGILPVFATRSPWIEVIGSYPAIEQKDALIFNLAQADEYLYHGVLLLGVPQDISHGLSATFGVHFVAIFGRESNRPLFWNVTAVHDLHATSTADLQSRTESVTKSITDKLFPVAHPAASHSSTSDLAGDSYPDASRHLRKRDQGLAVADHKDSDAFAEMDNRWYTFKSAGLEETSFDTHINLVLIGVHKRT